MAKCQEKLRLKLRWKLVRNFAKAVTEAAEEAAAKRGNRRNDLVPYRDGHRVSFGGHRRFMAVHSAKAAAKAVAEA